MTAHRAFAATAALSFVAVLAACSPGGGDGASGGCSTDLTVSAGGSDFSASSAAAVSIQDGAAYTVYGGDYAIDASAIDAFSAPVAPEGSSLVTIAITQFNATDPQPIAAGTTVPAGSGAGELVFVVTVDQGGSLLGNNMGAEGELTVREVGGSICLDVDYRDDEKSVTGTIGAAVRGQ